MELDIYGELMNVTQIITQWIKSMRKIETYKSIRFAKTRFAAWAKKSLFIQTPAQINPAQLHNSFKEESLGFDTQLFQDEFNAVVGAYKLWKIEAASAADYS